MINVVSELRWKELVLLTEMVCCDNLGLGREKRVSTIRGTLIKMLELLSYNAGQEDIDRSFDP
jgi:hypothetical protein